MSKQKWEYKTINLGPTAQHLDRSQKKLNKYGENGWELVSICQERHGTAFKGMVAILKRLK